MAPRYGVCFTGAPDQVQEVAITGLVALGD